MLHLLSVSMPRSGHHFLHRILDAAYGEGFGYCDFYGAWKNNSYAECCKSIPCTKAAGFTIFMQKNHDFKLRHPYSPESKYLVQIRHPVPRLISDFCLFVRKRPDQETCSGFEAFAEDKKAYYVDFWQKWVAEPRENIAILQYEKLYDDPASAVLASLERLSPGLAGRSNIREAVEKERQYSSMKREEYRPKPVQDFQFFDQDFMTAHVTEIAEQCKGFDYPIML